MQWAIQQAFKEPLDGVRDIVRDFLSKLPQPITRFDPFPPTDSLKAALRAEVTQLELALGSVERYLPWACQVVECFYPNHSFDLKVLIALCILVAFHIDDNEPDKINSLTLSLLTGQPPSDPILRCLMTQLLPRMWDYYDPLAANGIFVSFLEAISGDNMEKLSRDINLLGSAPAFPDWVRVKSGAPTQYAYWLFPRDQYPDIKDYLQAIPDIMKFINHGNEVLSFYKEELAEEKDNYVHMRSKTTGKSVLGTLVDISDETIDCARRLSTVLADNQAASVVLQGFVSRYVGFHLSSPRYRLREFLGKAQ